MAAKVTCPECGDTTATSKNGVTITCPACHHRHYVPAITAGRRGNRPAVEVECRSCETSWSTRARPQSAVKCPTCHRSVWVPASAPSSVPAERPSVPMRVEPKPARPAFVLDPAPVAPLRVEPPKAPAIAPAPHRTEQTQPTAVAGWASLAVAVGEMFGNGWPGRLPPADAVTVFDRIAVNGVESRTRRAPGPLPVDPAAVDRALASLMLTREPDWPAGSCPLGSCGELVDVRVVWGPDARLDVCDRHASRITAAAIRLARPAPTLTVVPPVR